MNMAFVSILTVENLIKSLLCRAKYVKVDLYFIYLCLRALVCVVFAHSSFQKLLKMTQLIANQL